MSSTETPVPDLSQLAQELTKIPIEAVGHDFLLKQSDAELEEFLNYVYVCGLTLKAKAEIAHSILEFRGKCKDKARRLRALPSDEAETLLAACPAEEAAEVRKAMDALANPSPEVPATQHLMGSHIESESVVNPGQPGQ